MICKCRNCGGRIEWKIGDTSVVCKNCDATQTIEKSDIYEQAGLLAAENTEEGLEQAMQLYHFISGWQDADQQYVRCRTRLGQMRWLVDSARLKEYENSFETKVTRWKKVGLTALIILLLCISVVTAVSLIRLRQYNEAANYFTAGEYERSAAAFMEIGDYKNSKARVYLSAVELYKNKQYDKALPYFVWLDGYIDKGYYLRKCQERLAEQNVAVKIQP